MHGQYNIIRAAIDRLETGSCAESHVISHDGCNVALVLVARDRRIGDVSSSCLQLATDAVSAE